MKERFSFFYEPLGTACLPDSITHHRRKFIMKECSRCKETKEFFLFSKSKSCKDGLNRVCKKCDSEKNKLRIRYPRKRCKSQNKIKCPKCLKIKFEHLIRSLDQKCFSCVRSEKLKIIITTKKCKKCLIEKRKESFYGDKRATDGFQCICKECKRTHQKTTDYRKRANVNERRKRKEDTQFNIAQNLRGRLKHCLKLKGVRKSLSAINLLGIDINSFKQYIEKQFLYGMSWQNRKDWHIDHIIPVSMFDLTKEEDQKKCFFYTNLMPRWATNEIAIKFSSRQIGNLNKQDELIDSSYYHLLENPS